MNADLNRLIGVPFKLGGRDFSNCDCYGIVCLYYKYVKDKILPSSDEKRSFFHKKRNYERMTNVIKTFTQPVSFKELDEGDIVLLKGCSKNIGALGVCINKEFILHMDRVVGSCLTRIRYLESLFLAAYRPC